MQPQRITSITLLATATTSFALNFLALFPTSLALAQTPVYLKPGHIFTEDEIRKFKLPDLEIEDEVKNSIRKAKDRQRNANDRLFEDLRRQQEFQEEQRQHRQQDFQESLSDFLQNPTTSKAEADRLFQQGLQQHKDSKFEAAIKLWQQALRIYQATGVREAFPQESRRQEAWTLNNLGAAYQNLGQHKQAIKFLQHSLGIAREIVNRSVEAQALRNLGSAYKSLGQYQQVIETLQQTLNIAQETDNPRMEVSALLNLGLNYLELEQYQRAIERFQQALTVARKANNTDLEAAALKGLLGTYLSLGQYQQITEIAQQAINTARKTGNSSLEASAQLSIGSVYYALQQHQQAIAPLQRALKLSQKTKEREIEISALNMLGRAYYSLGQSQQAIEFHQRALEIARKSKKREAEATALTHLGNAYVLAGQSQQSIGLQQQALEITRAVGNTDVEVQALLGLGTAYLSLGHIQQAKERQQMALKTAQASDRADLKIAALASLGSSYLVLGQYQQSIESLQQALKIAQEANSPLLEATVLTAMGGTYLSLGQYQRVIEIHQRILKLGQDTESPILEALALHNLGNAHNSLENYPQAIQFHQQALKVAKNFPILEATVLNSLGISSFRQEQYPQAIKFYQQSANIAREIGLPNPGTLNNLGVTYFTIGQNQQAIESLQQALAIARESKVRSAEADTLDSLGMVLLNTKKFSEAEPLLFDAIEILESLRTGLSDVNQVSVFDTQTNAYNNLQVVLVAQNKVDKALEIAERGRARALVDLLSRRLPTANTKIGTTDKQSVTLTSPSIAQIKQVAKEQNATLVEYSVIENDIKNDIVGEEIFVWVVKPTGEVAFRSVDLKSLDVSLSDLVVSSRKSIGVGERGSIGVVSKDGASPTKRLQQLHQLLIQPIADLLPTDPNAHVIFIPQGELFLVPFPALQDKSGKYLVGKHTILTAPAIQALDLTRQQRQQVSGKGALVVGNPIMPSVPLKLGEPPQKLKNLPNAEQEAKAIAPLLRTQAIIGSKASETVIKQQMPQAGMIHLATHGLLDDFKGLGVPGAIALAPSGKDDGLLHAGEILDMKLNAELVVLSACDTGRGRLTGDGVIGLSRSLISAGVPSVIVSLWSVPDAPTAFLMTKFYQNLQQNPDKAQALRQAMLQTMKKHPEPKDWAAFTLIGEAE